MGLEAYMWMTEDGTTARPGNIDDADHQHHGWIELKDYVHKLSPNMKSFDIMKKLDNNTPWMSEMCMSGKVIERVLIHSVSDENTLTMYELRNVVLLSTESREDDEEQADQIAAAIQTVAANSDKPAVSDEWTTGVYTSYNVEESADRYELFQVVCADVKLTSSQRDKAALATLVSSITGATDQTQATGFFT